MLLCVCGAVTNMKGERVTRYFASLPLLSDVHRARTCRQHDGRDELCDRGSGCDAVRREPAVQRVRKLPIGGKLSVYLAVDLHRLTWSCPSGQLRSSAGAGHDPTDDAGGLRSKRLVYVSTPKKSGSITPPL